MVSYMLDKDTYQVILIKHILRFMNPDVIKTAFDGSIKKLTTLRTLTDVMNKSEIYKGMLSEVNKNC